MNTPHEDPSSSFPPPHLTASAIFVEKQSQKILATHEIREITKIVRKLCKGKDKTESLELLYKCISERFPNCLVVKLLQVYRYAIVSPKIRSYALSLVDSLLMDLEDSCTGLRRAALEDIKEQLNPCLALQGISDHDFKLLSRIASRVAVSIYIENIPWQDFITYILSLEQDHMKILFIFGELPMVMDEEYLMPLYENSVKIKIEKGLSDPDCDEEWCLAIGAGFNMALQLLSWKKKVLVWDMFYAIVNSVWEMVNSRKKEAVVRKGVMGIVKNVRREAVRFRRPEYEVVARLASMMKEMNGVCEETKNVMKLVRDVLDQYYVG